MWSLNPGPSREAPLSLPDPLWLDHCLSRGFMGGHTRGVSSEGPSGGLPAVLPPTSAASARGQPPSSFLLFPVFECLYLLV